MVVGATVELSEASVDEGSGPVQDQLSADAVDDGGGIGDDDTVGLQPFRLDDGGVLSAAFAVGNDSLGCYDRPRASMLVLRRGRRPAKSVGPTWPEAVE